MKQTTIIPIFPVVHWYHKAPNDIPFPLFQNCVWLFILYHKHNDSILFCISMDAESFPENRPEDSNDIITDQPQNISQV